MASIDKTVSNDHEQMTLTITFNKDELADRVVKRASAEVKRAAIKKMVLNLGEEADDEN